MAFSTCMKSQTAFFLSQLLLVSSLHHHMLGLMVSHQHLPFSRQQVTHSLYNGSLCIAVVQFLISSMLSLPQVCLCRACLPGLSHRLVSLVRRPPLQRPLQDALVFPATLLEETVSCWSATLTLRLVTFFE